MNINEIVNDPELWQEFCIAYAMAGKRPAEISYKLAILNMPDTHIFDEGIGNNAMGETKLLVSAITGFISPDWKG
jgi:hypothetical protein